LKFFSCLLLVNSASDIIWSNCLIGHKGTLRKLLLLTHLLIHSSTKSTLIETLSHHLLLLLLLILVHLHVRNDSSISHHCWIVSLSTHKRLIVSLWNATIHHHTSLVLIVTVWLHELVLDWHLLLLMLLLLLIEISIHLRC
jgi:hypothetical protein